MNSQEPMDKLPEGTIRFVQQKKPVLTPGVYTIGIDHEIRVNENQQEAEDTLSVCKKFAVRGERFYLDEGHIHSTFPPEHAQGDFSRCLPHIVLKADTLPWERSACDQGSNPPWLALLTFYEDELDKIRVNSAKLSDLNAADEWLQRDSGESADDQCTIVEVPQQLLAEIIPTVDDLNWLCHIRQVSNEKKEDGAQGQQSDFAVIIGNRLPQQGKLSKKNRVHLVSLEGYYPEQGKKNRYTPVNGNVQLVSLKDWEFTTKKDWEFTTKGEVYSFSQAVGKLTPAVFRAYSADADLPQQQILERGYTLLRHQMRQGDKTVSLYRGPLVPAPMPVSVKLPITCADEALRFYQEWGLFDVSYAAAWQLGRLLALHNRGFSTALYQWKRDSRLQKIMQQEKQKTAQALGAYSSGIQGNAEPDEKVDHYAEVNSWLAGLKTLSEVPLHYLVPDLEAMLPKQSIRFFQLDMNWTRSLTDGAFSLGRVTTADLKQDEESHSIIDLQADHSARLLRNNPAPDWDSENGEESRESITGVLIRSDIIVNWPGLEVEAFGEDCNGLLEADHRLPLIRMQRLADNILMCLFEGNIARVDIHPPAEGLHYSIDESKQAMKIRNPQSGRYDDDPKYVGIINKEKPGVLDIDSLAKEIRLQFEAIDKDSFTCAHFAMAIISESNQVSFLKNSTSADAG